MAEIEPERAEELLGMLEELRSGVEQVRKRIEFIPGFVRESRDRETLRQLKLVWGRIARAEKCVNKWNEK
jgi:hypothetical protein